MEPGGARAQEGSEDPGGRSVPPLEPLSSDEVRALLDDFPGDSFAEGMPGAGEAPAARILLVSRRPDDVLLLRRCLANAGASVSLARNPFTALDHIRAELPDAVISDFDLWGNDGALLFTRIREAKRAPPVLFLAVGSRAEAAGLAARARSAGAAGLLLKPLKPGEVEAQVRALLDLAGELTLEPGSAAQVFAAPGVRAAGAGEAEHSPLPARLLYEVVWLRFFREASRVLIQPAGNPPDAAGALLRAALVELEATACGLLHWNGGRPSSRFEGREDLGHADLARLAASGRAPETDPGSLILSFGPRSREGRLVIAGLAPEVAAAAGEFREDIGALLAALFAA
jgi:CheY-like chemotaxis protein